ncbi:MAG: TonB-dependent receptor [Epsilonproteobacteria bacterium]|nr:TonB-dependent receptor [Campylobacterota bacterium]
MAPTLLKAEVTHLDAVIINGHQTSLIGDAISSSEGIIGQVEIESRPVLRAGEILEFVPGMVVTQHSGSGKANQYFLRGFNLDHGTDFRTTIEGMPINMRTHGHGHGYTDLNFIIPEFVQSIDYQKGPYYAEHGDFSPAGAASFALVKSVEKPFVSLEVGKDDYFRTLLGAGIRLNESKVFVGFEAQTYGGPWSDIDEDVKKYNALIRLYRPLFDGDLTMTFMGYENSWNSADQIPEYAVKEGLISDFGSIDKSVGGESSRYSLSARWKNDEWLFDLYTIASALDLFSNFTYFLDDPVNGDQFEQIDKRKIYGANLHKKSEYILGDNSVYQEIGMQMRQDSIEEVALKKTKQRDYLSTVRSDEVDIYSLGLYWKAEMALSDSWSVNGGIRYDYMHVDVESDLDINSGKDHEDILGFNGGVRYTFNPLWELYLNAGQSFHSNDARGAVITVDPVSGESIAPVDLLVQAEGAEIGLRFFDIEHLHLSAAFWLLELDSELLFVGDAGSTEASRASRRYGLEFTAYYWLSQTLTLDFEAAWSQARFIQGAEGEGDRVEGALPVVVSAGIGWEPKSHWNTHLRVRHFSKRVLDSFGDKSADPFSVVNFNLSYHQKNWQYGLDILNLFDSDDQDIAYYYVSRLQGVESEAREDIHFHPIEPRTFRFRVKYTF